MHTRQLQSELAALRQSASARAAAGGAGTAAAISAAEVSCRLWLFFPDRPYYLAAYRTHLYPTLSAGSLQDSLHLQPDC